MSTLTRVAFSVTGVPQPQGNKTAMAKGVMVEGRRPASREAFKLWRGALVDKARTVAETGGPFPDGPLHVGLTFWMPKPASAKKAETWAWKRPDIDKLERAVLDALTLSGLIGDDSRVCSVHKFKRYAIDRAPGVEVEVELID
jgi:crossover junction endodeoxyribonuclease RusA